MTEAYTVSKMMASINEVMGPVATQASATVSLKRKMDNGIMLDTSTKEIAYLDTRAKIKHSAQQVAALDRAGKMKYTEAQRRLGNDAFRRQEYQLAADTYIQALTALDFGDTPEEKTVCQHQLQLPLTCNLAACMLVMEEWEKARQICDQALQIDAQYIKALQQRGKALSKLNKFDQARADILLALKSLDTKEPESGDLRQRLENQLVDINRAKLRNADRTREQRQFQKKMMQEAVGRLYEDKKEVSATPNPHVDDAHPRTLWEYVFSIPWIFPIFALLIKLFSRVFARRGKVKEI